MNHLGVFLTNLPKDIRAGYGFFREFMVDSRVRLDENTQLRPRGGVPEWPKGSDCKSDGSAFGGSNPPPSTIFEEIGTIIKGC